MDPPTYRFGRFVIRADEKLLRRDGEPLPLPRKPIDTLLLLHGLYGQLLTKEQILKSNNGNYRQLLLNLMMSASRFDEGPHEIQGAARADPASIMVRVGWGRQYYLARRYIEAEKTLRAALALDTSFVPTHTKLSQTLAAAEARAELEAAMQKERLAQGLTDLAIIDAPQGHPARARRRLEDATRNGAALHYDLALGRGLAEHRLPPRPAPFRSPLPGLREAGPFPRHVTAFTQISGFAHCRDCAGRDVPVTRGLARFPSISRMSG